MPRFDGTGPWGLGPMTGRGMGFCSPGRGRYGLGYGPGFGRGWASQARGRGFGRYFWNFFPPYGCFPHDHGSFDEEAEKLFLEREKAILETQLENVKNALKSYEKEEDDE